MCAIGNKGANMSFFTAQSIKKNHLLLGCILTLISSTASVFAENEATKDDKKAQVATDKKSLTKPEGTKKEASETKQANQGVHPPVSTQNGPAAYTGKPKVIYMVLTDGPSTIEVGFKEYFAEKNIPIEYIVRDCGGTAKIKQCTRFVEEIKRLKPDLVYTYGTPAALAIAGKIDAPDKDKYLWDIPIVSGIIADPIASKIVYDLKDTGRNLTGVNHIPDYDSQVSAMQSYLPTKKIAIFYPPADVITPYNVAAIKKACIARKIEPVEFTFEHIVNGRLDESKLDEAFREIKAAGFEMVYLPSSNMLNAQSGPVSNAAHKHNLLTYIVSDGMLSKNATPLMGLIAYRVNVGRLMGVKAEQILFHNKTTRQIPYDRLEKFSFFIMKKVMLQLGIYPPLMTLNRSSFIGTQAEEEQKRLKMEEQRKLEEAKEKEKKKAAETETDKAETDDKKPETKEEEKPKDEPKKDTDDKKSETKEDEKPSKAEPKKEADDKKAESKGDEKPKDELKKEADDKKEEAKK